MEAAKHKNEEQNPQEQSRKAWIKPEMKDLDLQGGEFSSTYEDVSYYIAS